MSCSSGFHPGTVLQVLVLLVLIIPLLGCDPGPIRYAIAGPTMGTQYRIEAICSTSRPGFDDQVADVLERIDSAMSTYRPDSLLSSLNGGPTDQWLIASPELLAVLEAAETLAELSGGAFDVTVGPLVNLWGFGPVDRAGRVPTTEEIDRARARVGHQHLKLRPPSAILKQVDLYIDLSAIAKGYAVDQLSEALSGAGCPDHLVDIGGEIRIQGRKAGGRRWRIGIETPDPESFGGVTRILEADDIAMATSGDYRNYIETGELRYSHTIDPRTGRPVDHALASVTVLHASTLWADGFATLLNVMGPVDGLALAEQLELPALFIVRSATGFDEHATEAFARYLSN